MSGWTKVDNQVLEEIYCRKFSANELPIILAVWRSTYGWQKEEHEMGLSFIAGITGIDKKAVKRSLNSLIDNRVILVIKESDYNNSRILSFNKNFEEWNVLKRGQNTLQGSNLPPLEGTKHPPEEGSNLPPIKESIKKSKEIYKEKDDQMDKASPEALYEKLFGFPTAILQDDFRRWIEESQFQEPELIICEVIKRTAAERPRHPGKYLQKSVDKLLELGLFTLAAVQEYNSKFDKKSKVKKSAQDISLDRPSHWDEPKPLTEDEFCRMKALEAEMPY